MKIERLSENQIRCTLYKSDLADKELLLTELAYGTDKAKELFRELMQQASAELGFEADNIPLMIEAIPVSKDCLVLIITKVEDPEELDTRFSRFTRPLEESSEEDEEDAEDDFIPFAEQGQGTVSKGPAANSHLGHLLEAIGGAIGGLSENLAELSRQGASKGVGEAASAVPVPAEVVRLYAFKRLDDVILSSKLIKDIYQSENSLYKNPQDSRFYLYMTKGDVNDSDFARSCNIVGEYGSRLRVTYATKGHMDEHYKLIIDSDAVQQLAKL